MNQTLLLLAATIFAWLSFSGLLLAQTSGLPSPRFALQSSGPLAFGPNDALLIADPQAASIYSVETRVSSKTPPVEEIHVSGVDQRLAELLKAPQAEIQIIDLAAQPSTGLVYLSVARGLGATAQPIIVRVDGTARFSELPLGRSDFEKFELTDAPLDARGASAPDPRRHESITDLTYVNGRVYVAGRSRRDTPGASTLRAIPYPFPPNPDVNLIHVTTDAPTDDGPIRAVTPFSVSGQSFLLSALSRGQLATIALGQAQSGQPWRSQTIAAPPLDERPEHLIAYRKQRQTRFLVATSRQRLWQISYPAALVKRAGSSDVPPDAALTEALTDVTNVEFLDKLTDDLGIALIRTASGQRDLISIPLP